MSRLLTPEDKPPELEDEPPEPDDELFPGFELFPVLDERVPELEEPPEPDDEFPESGLQTPHEASQLPANHACPQNPQVTASLHDSEGRGLSVQTVQRGAVLVAQLPPAPSPPELLSESALGSESELPPEFEPGSESELESESLFESGLESELPSDSEAPSALELSFAVLFVPFDVPPAPVDLVLLLQSQPD